MKCSLQHRMGFTLVELLAVVAIVAVLMALLLPTLQVVRRSADNQACVTNLRQVGMALAAYCNDNDGDLPGPAYSSLPSTYYTRLPNPYTTLSSYLAPYFNLPVSPFRYDFCRVLLCPAYQKKVPSSLWSGGFSYYACYTVVNGANGSLSLSPWGRTGSTDVNNGPMKLVTLGTVVDLSKTWAIRDADLTNYGPTSTPGVAVTPVHGSHWNQLYFDFHVAAQSVP